jgi:hypothetical protein
MGEVFKNCQLEASNGYFLSPKSIPIVTLRMAGSPLILQHYDCLNLEHDIIIAREN